VPVVLYRVDERLIHGQVVVGWGHELRPDRYIVVDDAIAESEWEQELYALGAPQGEVGFVSVADARDRLDAWATEAARTVLLTRDIASMRSLLDGRSAGVAVNLGGVHAGSDRTHALEYLYLTERDRMDLRELERQGAVVTARNLPDAQQVPLDTILAP
jgi:PTS system mannose-specific IIB component/fructoselysine and glucoselysine-specific PTS system IIB component